jgi:hypothetical protein
MLIRFDLTKGEDGKYWISKWVPDQSLILSITSALLLTQLISVSLFYSRETSNIPSDMKMMTMLLFPGLISLGHMVSSTAGIGAGALGQMLPKISSP